MITVTLPGPQESYAVPAEVRKDNTYFRYARIGRFLERVSLSHKGVYLLYNDADQLIYVGRSIRTRSRLSNHLFSSKFRSEIARIDLIYAPTVYEQEVYESYAIWALNPIYNKAKKEAA